MKPQSLWFCVLTLWLVLSGSVQATVFGLKSCGSDSISCGTTIIPGSLPPTRLFSFQENGSLLTDLGTVKLGAVDSDVDALALSPTHGLLAFALEKSGATTIGSTLIRINSTTAAATAVGPLLGGRDLRGAVFDQADTLWVLDAASNQVLQINATTGSIVGTPLGLTLSSAPFDLSDAADIAVRSDGSFYVVDLATIFRLDIASGELTLVYRDLSVEGTEGGMPFGAALSGATFSSNAPQDVLFAYEINGLDDINRYAVEAAFARTTLLGNIAPTDGAGNFNAGRGDLAAFTPLVGSTPVPEPGTWILMSTCLVGLACYRLRRQHTLARS